MVLHTEGLRWREDGCAIVRRPDASNRRMEVALGVLKVYISRGCRGCERALELFSWVREAKPSLNVEVVDVSATDFSAQDSVFAVPAYVFTL